MTVGVEISEESRVESKPHNLEIFASIVKRVTFASHQNDVPVIAELRLRNPLQETFEDLELKIECEPALFGAKSWKIDRLSSGSEIEIRDRAVSVSGSLLNQLNERVRADVKIQLCKGDDVLVETRHDLIGLAKNEWGGASYMPELLAAFVMPNDPAVSSILKEVGETLRAAGQQPAIDGYQSKSRQRVWQIASAVWSAISARRLIYVEPPASFEIEGQKIRTPGEIWGDGLVTCLDAAVLFAAVFEQAGLNSVVAFTKGHALCGVWLQPQQLQTLTTDDCAELRKHISLKELVLFETTYAVNEPPINFSRAIEAADRQIAEEVESNFLYALDVKRARGQQITPLGVAVKSASLNDDAEGNRVVLGLEGAPTLPAFDVDDTTDELPDTPETRLDKWKRKLLDLTKRNRLLNLKPSKTAIRLYCSDPGVLEDKLAQGKRIKVIPLEKMPGRTDQRDKSLFNLRTGGDLKESFIKSALDREEIVADAPDTELKSGLIQLYRKAKTDLQEGGANTLFLALGMLKWKQSESEQRSYRAPLVLIPVKLERRSAASPVTMAHHDDEPVFNLTLLEMLRQDFDLRVPQLEGELPKDDHGVDVALIWEYMRKAVRDMPGFEVTEEVVLSTFSFAKFLMWKDLADRTDELKKSGVVNHLIGNPRDPYEHSADFIAPNEIDQKIDPADLYMPLPADGSQVVAINASSKGGDFVLEGPPGTGKSQTIANIIAHNLALGRKVLFVSEKMAALEVVYRRLRERGLGDFCLELHSNKSNKRHVLDQLGQSMLSSSAKPQAEWREETRKVADLRDKLNGLVDALHSPGVTGISPRAAIGRAIRWQDLHRSRLNWEGGLEADRARSAEDLERMIDVARKLGKCYGELDTQDQETFKDIEKSDWSHAWQSRLVESSQRLVNAIDNLSRAVSEFVKEAGLQNLEFTISAMEGLSLIAETLPLARDVDLGFSMGSDYRKLFASFESASQNLDEFRKELNQLSCQYPEAKVVEEPIAPLREEWHKANSQIWPFRPIKRWSCSRRVRAKFGLSEKPFLEKDLPILEILKSRLSNIEKETASLSEHAIWRGLETNTSSVRQVLEAGKKIREGIAKIAPNAQQLPILREAIKRICVESRELLEPGFPLATSADAIVQSLKDFEAAYARFCSDGQVTKDVNQKLSELKSKAQGIVDLQPRINAWCRWQASRCEAESVGLESLISDLQTGIIRAEESEECFLTAYCVWLAGRLIDKREPLRTFSALQHEEKIQEFRKLDGKLADLAVDYIRAKVSGEIPDESDEDRAPGYGVLNRELQKRRRHMPVRQLVAEMGDALTTLTPCLLMSPLSISQFLAADKQLFDLVVFDEASQITVWDAIGAIARGRNAIVVGDPKQMPPTSFFDRSASSDDNEEYAVDDLESILDEALAASIKHHRLTGHYRSKHESLICFSNHRYYRGELITYPSCETKDSAVSLVKVNGTYARGKGRNNPEEAKAVVNEVLNRLNDPVLSRQSIGIVTLNIEQQRTIEDLLDQARRKNPDIEQFFSDDYEEPVFVKNLETVQGDQRDVILLSIAYGPNDPGAKTISMNFGPLNRQGGERRLNVAITRATSEVIIYSSFDPSMIDLTRTSAQAVRDLKHYMEFAQRGPSALGAAVMSVGGIDSFDSDFEEAVALGLRKRGWTVHTQIGVSKFRIDLGIVHPDIPGRYLAGVECDGATYHSSPSARDRDRVRHAILENLDWKLVRLWSTDYWIDPIRALDGIHERLNELLELDRAQQPVEEPERVGELQDIDEEEEVKTEERRTAPLSGSVTKEEPSVNKTSLHRSRGTNEHSSPAEASSELSAEKFYEDDYLPTLRDLGKKIVSDFGPVTFTLLCKMIARKHGFNRTGTLIQAQVRRALESSHRTTESPNGEIVYWPTNQEPQGIVNFRGLKINGQKRAWQDVPYPEKLGLAQSVSGRSADPVIEMACRIGLGRLRQTTREELEKLLREVSTRGGSAS